jgi:hypothetical protein
MSFLYPDLGQLNDNARNQKSPPTLGSRRGFSIINLSSICMLPQLVIFILFTFGIVVTVMYMNEDLRHHVKFLDFLEFLDFSNNAEDDDTPASNGVGDTESEDDDTPASNGVGDTESEDGGDDTPASNGVGDAESEDGGEGTESEDGGEGTESEDGGGEGEYYAYNININRMPFNESASLDVVQFVNSSGTAVQLEGVKAILKAGLSVPPGVYAVGDEVTLEEDVDLIWRGGNAQSGSTLLQILLPVSYTPEVDAAAIKLWWQREDRRPGVEIIDADGVVLGSMTRGANNDNSIPKSIPLTYPNPYSPTTVSLA